jgi:hypothetical protein
MNRLALVAALAAAASAAAAQDAPKRAAPLEAVVEAVQMPAWVEQGGARVPLAPAWACSRTTSCAPAPTRGSSSSSPTAAR